MIALVCRGDKCLFAIQDSQASNVFSRFVFCCLEDYTILHFHCIYFCFIWLRHLQPFFITDCLCFRVKITNSDTNQDDDNLDILIFQNTGMQFGVVWRHKPSNCKACKTCHSHFYISTYWTRIEHGPHLYSTSSENLVKHQNTSCLMIISFILMTCVTNP